MPQAYSWNESFWQGVCMLVSLLQVMVVLLLCLLVCVCVWFNGAYASQECHGSIAAEVFLI